MAKEKLHYGNVKNIQPIPYDFIHRMPISLRIVTIYAMLISKEYLNVRIFSWGEKETSKYQGWGIIGYYERVSSILGMNNEEFDKVLSQIDFKDLYYNYFDISMIPTTVLGTRRVKSRLTTSFVRTLLGDSAYDMHRTSTEESVSVTVNNAAFCISTYSRKGLDAIKFLRFVLPNEVVDALDNYDALKIVLGNQTESLLPKINIDCNTIIGGSSTHTLKLKK